MAALTLCYLLCICPLLPQTCHELKFCKGSGVKFNMWYTCWKLEVTRLLLHLLGCVDTLEAFGLKRSNLSQIGPALPHLGTSLEHPRQKIAATAVQIHRGGMIQLLRWDRHVPIVS